MFFRESEEYLCRESPERMLGFRTASVLLWGFICAGCATQRPPGGGPPDAEPPRIVETSPAHGTIRFSGDRLTFLFDEYVDRRSFEQAFHLTPPLESPTVFKWSGKQVEALLGGRLKANRTYVATVGATVRDVRAGNQMSESFTLAFSTGENLDKGRLSGRIYDEAPAGVAVLAYDLSGLDPDTLDPRSRAPDYVIQTSENGAFRFTNMADGRYRIFAVRDRGNNLRYDPETDAFGVAPDDVYVRQLDTLSAPLPMRLAMEDTTAPYLQSASAPHSGAILLRFSETVSGLDAAAAKLRDSATGTDIGIIAAAEAPDTRHGILLFSSEPMRSTRYFLDPGPVCDISGNCMLESSCRTTVEGVDTADNTNVRLLRSFPEVRAAAFPVDSPFVLLFSKPMASAYSVTLTDSNKAEHPVQAEWTSPLMLTVRHARLSEASRFTLCADLRLMRDSLRGKIAGDTMLCIPFTTDRPSESGAISGLVEVRSKAAGRLRVRARHVESNRAEITDATGNGSYSFPSAPPGRFLLDAFMDADDDGLYSHGRPFPFKPSERFGANADTVRVRTRWETRGANTTIIIP